MEEKEKFSFWKLISGPFNLINYVKLGTFIVCGLIVFAVYLGIVSIKEKYFPTKKPSTSTTTVEHVESGGISTITNINNPTPDLKSGLYISAASDRASVGVFKEVAPNLEIELGAGETYDSQAFAEVKLKVKF